jgi:hypothetical protein
MMGKINTSQSSLVIHACSPQHHKTEGPTYALFVWLISQQYFSLRTNQPPATSQQYFSLTTNQHQPSATSQNEQAA